MPYHHHHHLWWWWCTILNNKTWYRTGHTAGMKQTISTLCKKFCTYPPHDPGTSFAVRYYSTELALIWKKKKNDVLHFKLAFENRPLPDLVHGAPSSSILFCFCEAKLIIVYSQNFVNGRFGEWAISQHNDWQISNPGIPAGLCSRPLL